MLAGFSRNLPTILLWSRWLVRVLQNVQILRHFQTIYYHFFCRHFVPGNCEENPVTDCVLLLLDTVYLKYNSSTIDGTHIATNNYTEFGSSDRCSSPQITEMPNTWLECVYEPCLPLRMPEKVMNLAFWKKTSLGLVNWRRWCRVRHAL